MLDDDECEKIMGIVEKQKTEKRRIIAERAKARYY